jgi:hypothetical protein
MSLGISREEQYGGLTEKEAAQLLGILIGKPYEEALRLLRMPLSEQIREGQSHDR